MIHASILNGEQYMVLGGRQQLLFERRVEKASKLLYTTIGSHSSSAISSFRSIVSCSWLVRMGLVWNQIHLLHILCPATLFAFPNETYVTDGGLVDQWYLCHKSKVWSLSEQI